MREAATRDKNSTIRRAKCWLIRRKTRTIFTVFGRSLPFLSFRWGVPDGKKSTFVCAVFFSEPSLTCFGGFLLSFHWNLNGINHIDREEEHKTCAYDDGREKKFKCTFLSLSLYPSLSLTHSSRKRKEIFTRKKEKPEKVFSFYIHRR